MYSRKVRFFGRFLVIGSAAVLIQLGGVAAADQRSDYQEQVVEVLSGTVAAHVPQLTNSLQSASSSNADAQAFARELLLGSRASLGASAQPTHQPRSAPVDPATRQDIQALVRRQLLGEHSPAGGAS
jgi:hypothetical protein